MSSARLKFVCVCRKKTRCAPHFPRKKLCVQHTFLSTFLFSLLLLYNEVEAFWSRSDNLSECVFNFEKFIGKIWSVI